MSKFYTISEDGKSITCHACNMTSYSPEDVKHKFCGNCRVFLEDLEARFDAHRERVLKSPDFPGLL